MWNIITLIIQLGTLLLSRYFKYRDKKERINHREKIKDFKKALKADDTDTVNRMFDDLMHQR